MESIEPLGHRPPASQPDFQTLASLLRNCGSTKDLSEGKRLHAHLIKRGLHRNLLLGNILLQMYSSCGSLPHVADCFSSMDQKNRFSWNFLITAYARHGQQEQAVCVFRRMHCEGFLPNEFIFTSAISACASNNAVIDGRYIHMELLESGVQLNVTVLNALINMYGKCSCLTYARRVFDQVQDRNVISWTGMISGYLHNGYGKEAIFLYIQMYQEGVLPNQVTFISMLDAYALHELLTEGKQMHAYIIGSDLESEMFLATSLVNMYGKCGDLENALKLFIFLTERNTILWTAMIQGCVQQGQAAKALQLYSRMLLEGMLPDSFTYSSIFDGCASQKALTMGKRVHATMVAGGLPFNVVTATSLINMYGKCGAIEEARFMFDTIKVHNSHSWTSMISLYAQYGDSNEAIQLFIQMQMEGVSPDKVTFWSVVDACTNQAALDEGKWVHGLITNDGLESDPNLATSLINMYGESGELEEARDLFNSMPEKNLVSWTAMITAYAQCGCEEEALLLYDQMLQEALVKMYGKCANQHDARRVFDELKERNVISWNTMLAVYSHHGCTGEALELFEQMQGQGFGPSKATLICVLDVCASEATLCKGKLIHMLAVKIGFDLHVDVGNAIINMCGKCGRLMDALKVFEKMQEERDAISWNTMIGLLAQHGQSKAALNLFEKMLAKGYLPDKVTYVAILSACGHAGLIGEGLQHFNSLMKNSSITPTAEHCHCVIHMFARSGSMESGESFVDKVPLQPTSVTWMSLLNACRVCPDMSRGEHAVQHAIELDEEKASSYVMLSNIYAVCGSEEESAADLRCDNEMFYEAVSS